ncbi:MAG: PDDEXK nuclease domain-containing protein [Bacteroidales bacterium]|jgi:predicted nuclease of restriction endonuclease-like (RecB) superfamily|nr:PDDEXK nuclease domain-containing protein [Bacteroidales bacterium]
MKGEEKLSTQYNDAVKQIKTAILQSQAKALKGVNQEQLALYYGIGRFISQNSRAGFWGKDAIDTISRQLSTEVPGLRGFSPRNLRNMRMFYEEWKCLDTNLADASAKLDLGNKSADESANLDSCKSLAPLEIADIPIVAFFSIGFSHHTLILSKTKTLEERRYYIQLCSDLQLSYDALERKITEDAYHNQGNMPNNFGMTIPDYKRAFQAIQMFKDEYLLDYINVEQLGERDEDIDERVIENEIVHNVKNFIMTFGRGFSYMGNQVHYDKLGHDHWVDLLFFNRILKSLVVIELKKGSFKPAYLGQLAAYLRVLDDEERIEGENPSVGIVLCKDADRAYVEYVLQDYTKPMGVATYKSSQERLRELLPDEEEIKKLL